MATSKPAYNKGPPPKYLNDFSKALASEVRILLAEVGKLRDERRALQFEIAELMSVKSKHGAGGEYAPHWKPTVGVAPFSLFSHPIMWYFFTLGRIACYMTGSLDTFTSRSLFESLKACD